MPVDFGMLALRGTLGFLMKFRCSALRYPYAPISVVFLKRRL